MRAFLPTLAAALLLSSWIQADTLIGRIVDENGVGIANGDVDAFDINADDDEILTGDSTDANGFFNITIPGGFYDLTFQGFPGSNFIDFVMPEVTISGTLDVGTITLELGNVLSGRVVDINGFPIAQCDLDIYDAGGNLLMVSGARTDLFGNYSILVPSVITIHYDPRNAFGGPFAPLSVDLVLAGNTNLGDTVLPPGLTLSGTVLGPGGIPVQNADIDCINSAGDNVLIYNDSTNASGVFSVIISADVWEVAICPAVGTQVVAQVLTGVNVTGNTNLGTINMQGGVTLFGTVRDNVGNPIQGANMSAFDAGGNEITLCHDGTNAAGMYSIIVPTGTLDVVASAPGWLGIHNDVAVGATMQLDFSCSPCPAASATERNGNGTNPARLHCVTPPRISRTLRVELDCTGYSSGFGLMLLNNGFHAGINTAFGQYLLSGSSIFVLAGAHTGNVLLLEASVPPNVALCGRMGYAQGLILPPPGPHFTNALDLIVGN